MRITEFITNNTFLNQVRSTRADVVKFNNEVSTGKRVTKPSDDVNAFSSSKLIEELIQRSEQFKRNAGVGLFQARTAQDSLEQMQNRFTSIKTLATEAASDTKNADDRLNFATQVRALRDDVINLANARFNDTYLFAGTNSDEAPFFQDVAGAGGVETNSTDRPLKVLVGDASIVNTTITGMELRQGAEGDIFEAIERTIQAMENNDRDEISASIQDLDNALTHVISQSTKIANTINRLEFIDERLDDLMIDQKGEVGRLTDADIIESMLNFRNAQSSYETVLAVQSRMLETSLLNFLR